jgi:hypothetical protein
MSTGILTATIVAIYSTGMSMAAGHGALTARDLLFRVSSEDISALAPWCNDVNKRLDPDYHWRGGSVERTKFAEDAVMALNDTIVRIPNHQIAAALLQLLNAAFAAYVNGCNLDQSIYEECPFVYTDIDLPRWRQFMADMTNIVAKISEGIGNGTITLTPTIL